MKKLLHSALLLCAITFASSAFANKVKESLDVEIKKPVTLVSDTTKIKQDFLLFKFISVEPARADTTSTPERLEKKEN